MKSCRQDLNSMFIFSKVFLQKSRHIGLPDISIERKRSSMPFYEYQAIDTDRSCGFCKERFETIQSILSDPLENCPECGGPIKKFFPLIAGVIIKGREANQFNDIHAAKYWRDKNGNRHLVTSADGYSTSSTVDRQTSTSGEVKAKTKRDRKAERQKRINLTSARAKNWNREQVRKADSWGSGHVAEES